jgi:16S rRNA C967 or C1407 C5-methylase (RsmB/RsmF family)
MVQILVDEQDLTQVEVKRVLERKCFMIDPHCPNVIMFHYSLRDKIINSEFVKSAKLVIQDKSSCLAPHTVMKLLTKKDDVVVTNLSGGLVAAFIGSMMGEYEGKVMVFGTASEEKYKEINEKLQLIGCAKYVKLMREDFLEVKSDDARLENVKVILVNAACSKSALMNPMEFLFQEGEDVKFLRDYTLDVNNPNKVKKCIQTESNYLKHALKSNRFFFCTINYLLKQNI